MADATWPEPAALDELYRRLRTGGMLARSDFITVLLDPLLGELRAAHRGTDDHLLIEAAEDALLSVVHNPDVYNPGRGITLAAFLRMAARGDLLNALKKASRHQDKFDPNFPVEYAPDPGNDSAEDGQGLSFDDSRLAAVIAGFTDEERRLFELMRDGVRETEPAAAILGLEDRPQEEQRAAVKRAKERIFKRLQRAVEGS